MALSGGVGGRDSGPELLDAGPPPVSRRRWVVLGTVGVVVLVLVGFSWTAGRDDLSAPRPSPTPSRSTPPPSRAPVPTPSASVTPPVVIRGSGPLAPGLRPGVLYAYTSTSLFAVGPTTGTVTRTDGIKLGTGPVDVIPTTDGLLLRSSDSGPGAMIRDGKVPSEPAGFLQSAGQVLPGPVGKIWVGGTDMQVTMRLVDARGRATGPRVSSSGSFSADGRGGLLLSDLGGVWQAYPGPLRRITVGTVAAVGPRYYRLTSCDAAHRCWDDVYDRTTGKRRRIGPVEPSYESAGLVSADGRFSVSVLHSNDGTTVCQVARLSDGKVVRTFSGPAESYGSSAPFAVWLSTRWLAVLQQGQLVLYDVDARTTVTPDLPTGLLGLAWRPAS